MKNGIWLGFFPFYLVPVLRDRSQFPFLSSPVLATSWDEEVGESRKKKKGEGQENNNKKNYLVKLSFGFFNVFDFVFSFL